MFTYPLTIVRTELDVNVRNPRVFSEITTIVMMRWLSTLAGHGACFALFSGLSLIVLWKPLGSQIASSGDNELFFSIVLILLVSMCLVYMEKKSIFISPRYCLAACAPVLAIVTILYFLGKQRNLAGQGFQLSPVVLFMITTLWVTGFVLCFGVQSAWAAKFPLSFVILMVTGSFILHQESVYALQKGSAAVTYALFKLLGVPVLRQSFTFSLPGVDIAITEECSGIRSSLTLFVTSILAGQVFLHSNWRKALFSVFTIPVVVFKNAVRIVTLSCLGVYADPSFLHGRLHRYGGLPFSFLSLAILLPLLFALQKKRCSSNQCVRANSAAGVGHDLTPLASPREHLRPGRLICKDDSTKSRREEVAEDSARFVDSGSAVN